MEAWSGAVVYRKQNGHYLLDTEGQGKSLPVPVGSYFPRERNSSQNSNTKYEKDLKDKIQATEVLFLSWRAGDKWLYPHRPRSIQLSESSLR